MYDASLDRAFWLDVQAAFGGVRRFRMSHGPEQLTIRIPVTQVLSANAVQTIREIKRTMLGRLHGDHPND
jgi:hypothetical protein